MLIRLAKQSDYVDLMNLYNQFVGEDRYSKQDNDSYAAALKSPTNFIFVAEDKGKLVGFATLSVKKVVRYPRSIAELDELFVVSEYRQQGLGRQLMVTVENKAKELDCYRVYIESRYNFTVAHNFYETLGYVNYGYHFMKNI